MHVDSLAGAWSLSMSRKVACLSIYQNNSSKVKIDTSSQDLSITRKVPENHSSSYIALELQEGYYSAGPSTSRSSGVMYWGHSMGIVMPHTPSSLHSKSVGSHHGMHEGSRVGLVQVHNSL